VQIVGAVSVRAAANTNRSAAPSTRGHGARNRRVVGRRTYGRTARNGSDEDSGRKAGLCKEATVLEPHPSRGVWIQYCDARILANALICTPSLWRRRPT
jgi:hypothetical protein